MSPHITRAERVALYARQPIDNTDADPWHGRTVSNLTSRQPFHNAWLMVTYELDEDGSVIPMTVCVNGEEVDADEFGAEMSLAWAKGIEAELKSDAALLGEDRAQDASWRAAA